MIAPPKPPSHDELEALIKEARVRQLRRRLLGAAGVAIAAALGLSAYALSSLSAGPATPTGGSTGAGAPSCRAPQLATSAEGGAGEGAGHAGASIQIVDRSGHACALPTGVPAVRFTLRGKTAPMEEQTMAPPYSPVGLRAGRVLVPGRKVMYILDWSGPCPNAAAAPTSGTAIVILRFRSGLRIATPEITPENVPIVPGCGRKRSRVSVSPLLRVSA
jgi:hypothetical protein